MDAVTDKRTGSTTDRPIQLKTYTEKIAKGRQWFKDNIDHYVSKSSFSNSVPHTSNTSRDGDLKTLYGVYNNEFPLEWFSHITNPLNADNPKYKNFPAKIRPVTILRTNIDLLLGEFPRRPYVYSVDNLDEGAYNRYQEQMKAVAQQHFHDIFVQEALMQLQASGQELTEEQLAKIQEDPGIPEEIKKNFSSSYKDNLAIKGQRWLRKTIRLYEVKRKQHKMFKHWLIAGETYSFKGVVNGEVMYKEVSPLNFSYDESMLSDFVEDGEWCVHREFYTLAEITDRFYLTLKKAQLEDLENYSGGTFGSPQSFYSHYQGVWSENYNKIPVYHVQWKGRKKIGFLTYMDPETFQMVEERVDEDYIVDETRGEKVEWRWDNELYEGYRIGEDLYTEMDVVKEQRKGTNRIIKLNYNGRRYSDTHSNNLSVLKIGIPFQLMYMICNYTLEKTLAKSKGKIFLLDANTVPDGEEEKFFYWSEAKGYALLNRNQVGVDKSWNQYQVVDMTLFDSIKQLIELMDYYKQQWDDVIGINRQRKGQTYSSDGQGVNERATFQSTVITDMIFIGFEEFIQRELQGILDLAKYTTAEGDFSLINEDAFHAKILEIFPEDFSHELLGVHLNYGADEQRKLEEMKGYAQAMLQNNQKSSTVLEVIAAENVAELKQQLKRIEEIEAASEQAMAENEEAMNQAADERQMRYMEYEKLLDTEFMNSEYDRKEDLEHIQGTYNLSSYSTGDSNADGIPDATQIQKILNDREKISTDRQDRAEKRAMEKEKLNQKKQEFQHQMKMDKENVKIQKEKNKIARSKPAAKKK